MSESGKSYNFAINKGNKYYFSIPAKSVYEFIGFIDTPNGEQCKIVFDDWALMKHPSGEKSRMIITLLEERYQHRNIEIIGFEEKHRL